MCLVCRCLSIMDWERHNRDVLQQGVPIDFQIVNDGSHQRVRTPVKRSELIIVALAFTALDDWAGLAIALSFYGQIT